MQQNKNIKKQLIYLNKYHAVNMPFAQLILACIFLLHFLSVPFFLRLSTVEHNLCQSTTKSSTTFEKHHICITLYNIRDCSAVPRPGTGWRAIE